MVAWPMWLSTASMTPRSFRNSKQCSRSYTKRGASSSIFGRMGEGRPATARRFLITSRMCLSADQRGERGNIAARSRHGGDSRLEMGIRQASTIDTSLAMSGTRAITTHSIPAGEKITVPTVVLIGYPTASAAEDFLIYADKVPHFTKVGQPTYGSTGQPLFFDLPAGFRADLHKTRHVPDGRDFVGVGVQRM